MTKQEDGRKWKQTFKKKKYDSISQKTNLNVDYAKRRFPFTNVPRAVMSTPNGSILES